MQILDDTRRLTGGSLHWYEAGSGELPVVLLHGGGGTGRAWLHQLQILGERGFRVLAPDMPGFGRSDWFSGVERMPDIGPVLFEWLDMLGIHQAVVGGNSMGGRVAMSMASAHPERIRGLIILDSVGLDLPDVKVTNPLTLPASGYTAGLVYDPERYKARTPYRTLDDARELNRGRGSFARYLGDGEIGPDPALDVARLTMPTLLIWGREDQIVPLPYGKVLDQHLAHSELVVIDQCGHLPHIEEPDITNHAILDFLDRLSH
ncbi:alpha/beta fold hydrolase [Sulfobacillus harzensis]|uniref:Alpha/beta hydrolase n=1 Tax=Sulfobacillus harzensis TaxID=2729629 RepID=A0A7Y0L6G9_9FIRM|nr:alpha/beta hydrolase [Sulfobacillus harzensis]NMP24203.1 alpha/beta hydrolase [Sulfobacillus harzensis]